MRFLAGGGTDLVVLGQGRGDHPGLLRKERVQKASQLAVRGVGERSLQFAAKMIAHNILPDWINEIQDSVEKGRAIAKFIEGGGFDRAPYDAVKTALPHRIPRPAEP